MEIFENIDCMVEMRKYPDKFFDLAIVDPPYGIGDFTKVGDPDIYKQRADKKYGKVNWNYKIPNRKYFNELIRISKNRIIWGANYFWKYIPEKNFICWYKDNSSSRWSKCEIASTTIGVNEFIKLSWNGFIRCENVERIHPCQKPIKLYKWILNKYANEGDIIFDSHVGSGSSLIACKELKFSYVGFEIDKNYYDKTCKRIKNWEDMNKYKLDFRTNLTN